jgi:predicted RNase H-like HicB family nuclease
MTRKVLLYPGEDGFLVAEVPSLPGCISQGQTRDEALANIREAITLHEEVLRERGEPQFIKNSIAARCEQSFGKLD